MRETVSVYLKSKEEEAGRTRLPPMLRLPALLARSSPYSPIDLVPVAIRPSCLYEANEEIVLFLTPRTV